MRKIILLGLVIELLFLSGCSPGIVGKTPKVDNDFATVYIARKAGAIGCGNAFLIQLNDKDFIRLACGMKTYFKIPAGEKIKISSVSSSIADDFYLEPVKGENYYFGMDCNFGACWFDELNKRQYDKIAYTCTENLVIDAQEQAPPSSGTAFLEGWQMLLAGDSYNVKIEKRTSSEILISYSSGVMKGTSTDGVMYRGEWHGRDKWGRWEIRFDAKDEGTGWSDNKGVGEMFPLKLRRKD
jgi:hypothetical protein